MFRHAPTRGFNAPQPQPPHPQIIEAGPEANAVIDGFDVPQELPANGEMDEPTKTVQASTITVGGENEVEVEERRDSALSQEDAAESSHFDKNNRDITIPATVDEPSQGDHEEQAGSQVVSSVPSPLTIQPTDDFDLYPYCQYDTIRLFPFKEQPMPTVTNPPSAQTPEISHQIDMRLRLESIFPRYSEAPYDPFQTTKPAHAPAPPFGPSRPMYARGSRIVRPQTWQVEDMVYEYVDAKGDTMLKRRGTREDMNPQPPQPPSPSSSSTTSNHNSPIPAEESATLSPSNSSNRTITPAGQSHDDDDDNISPPTSTHQTLDTFSTSSTPQEILSPANPNITIQPTTAPIPSPPKPKLRTIAKPILSLLSTVLVPFHYLKTKLRLYMSSIKARRGPLGRHDTPIGRALRNERPFEGYTPNAFERHGYDRDGGYVRGQLEPDRSWFGLQGGAGARGSPSTEYGTFGGGGDLSCSERERVAERAYFAAVGVHGRHRRTGECWNVGLGEDQEERGRARGGVGI